MAKSYFRLLGVCRLPQVAARAGRILIKFDIGSIYWNTPKDPDLIETSDFYMKTYL
jgi:hypothetical protein